jgi:hypothetical protein
VEAAFQGMDPNELSLWMSRKISALRRGDFFTCAGELQKKYFFGWLLQAGVDLTQETIFTIPVSVSPEMPPHEWPDSEVNFVFGGQFLPWQDPSLALMVLVEEMETRIGAGLTFLVA